MNIIHPVEHVKIMQTTIVQCIQTGQVSIFDIYTNNLWMIMFRSLNSSDVRISTILLKTSYFFMSLYAYQEVVFDSNSKMNNIRCFYLFSIQFQLVFSISRAASCGKVELNPLCMETAHHTRFLKTNRYEYCRNFRSLEHLLRQTDI